MEGDTLPVLWRISWPARLLRVASQIPALQKVNSVPKAPLTGSARLRSRSDPSVPK